MIKIYVFAHYVCAWVATIATVVLIDLPLKIIITLVFTIIFIICSILYPIIKYIDIKEKYCTNISAILKYAISKKCNVAIKIKNLWDIE
jgi:hypothetical protein